MVLPVRKQELKICQSQIANKLYPIPIPWAFSPAVEVPSHQSNFHLFFFFFVCLFLDAECSWWLFERWFRPFLVRWEAAVKRAVFGTAAGEDKKNEWQDYIRLSCLLTLAWVPSYILALAPLEGSPGGLQSLLLLWSPSWEEAGRLRFVHYPRLKDAELLSSWIVVTQYCLWGTDGANRRRWQYIRLKSRWQRGILPAGKQKHLMVLCISKAYSPDIFGGISLHLATTRKCSSEENISP